MRALVAGHLCLDVEPLFEHPPSDGRELFAPGRLFPIASTRFSPGGAVANTGGALQAFGIDTRLVARVGRDAFGAGLEELLRRAYPKAELGLLAVDGMATSYSIIISSPGFDRIFFHHAGANDAFTAGDVTEEQLADRDLLHFGYPPAMRAIYENDGEELRLLLARAKERGLTTSLDLSYPQPSTRAAQVDWRSLLGRVLPLVDLFLPGFSELHFMLTGEEAGAGVSAGALRDASQWVLDCGCPVCVLKLGEEGVYVRTTGNAERLAGMGRCGPRGEAQWRERELLEPCYVVEAQGTTGAGDVTIAGFLAALLRGASLEEATRMGLAAGAAKVEGPGTVEGLPDWEQLVARTRQWRRRESRIPIEGR